MAVYQHQERSWSYGCNRFKVFLSQILSTRIQTKTCAHALHVELLIAKYSHDER